MKVSQKELELLSNTDTDQLVEDVWERASRPPRGVEEVQDAERKSALLLQFVAMTHGAQKRAIENALSDLEDQLQVIRSNPEADRASLAITEIKDNLKSALKGDIRYPSKHISRRSKYQELSFVIQLVPAFPGHPEFEVTYYAGFVCPPDFEAQKTHDVGAAARWIDREDAERVASQLLNTKSCIWKVVEA
jgi:hypothetical protein